MSFYFIFCLSIFRSSKITENKNIKRKIILKKDIFFFYLIRYIHMYVCMYVHTVGLKTNVEYRNVSLFNF